MKLENTFNSLLEKALPNDFQKYKIYKHLARYYEYKEDYFSFNSKLFAFYEIPKKQRCYKRASQLFQLKMSSYDYQILALGFHNSIIQHHEIFKKATDLKWIITENFKLPEQITTAEILFASLVSFNKPSSDQNFLIQCEDFLDSWKQVCFTRFGDKFEKYIDEVYPLVSEENSKFDINVQAMGIPDAGNTVQLTQTQIDWIEDLLNGLDKGTELKKHPELTPIENPKLKHLNHHVIAYNKILKATKSKQNQQIQILVDSLVGICKELLNTNREENLWNVTNKSRES